MQPGRSSRTAVFVAMGRALAHGTTAPGRFDDPTALALLPDEARARIERIRSGAAPSTFRQRLGRGYLRSLSKTMATRTIAIDDAIRAVPAPQLVILGAGLDGRAWRLPELQDTVVFEVDHPDTQREKRERAARLTSRAREVRFVAVDFTRDRLQDALEAAGHDPTRPTTWVWEGVVMYLTPAEVEVTLTAIAGRSAAGSRLIVLYHHPALLVSLMRPLLRRIGEPLRSSFTVDAMRALLARHGFRVASDETLAEIGARLSPDLARATRSMRHMRVAIADL